MVPITGSIATTYQEVLKGFQLNVDPAMNPHGLKF